jgi:hypothetical protein
MFILCNIPHLSNQAYGKPYCMGDHDLCTQVFEQPNIQTCNTHILLIQSYTRSQKNSTKRSHTSEHQKSDNTRHKGHEQRKEKYLYLLIPNSIQFNFNYNILIFNVL